jgi:hypothetical protein
MFRSTAVDDEAASLALALKLQAEFDGEGIGTTRSERWPNRLDDKSEQSRHSNRFQRGGKFSFRPSRGSRFQGRTDSGPVEFIPAVEPNDPMTDEELAKLLQQQEEGQSGPGNTSSDRSRPTSSSSSVRRRPVPPPPPAARFLPASPPITPVRQTLPTPSGVDDDLPPPYTPRGSSIPQPPAIMSPPYTPDGRDGPVAAMEQRINAVCRGADSESEYPLLDEDRSTTVFVLLFSTNS